MKAAYDDLMRELLAEQARYDEHADEHLGDWRVPNPYEPARFANRIVELGRAALPYLIDTLEHDEPGAAWAIHVLEQLGVLDVLETYAPFYPYAARAVFRVDPARAIALDLHRQKDAWHLIYDDVQNQGADELAKHVARLLEDPFHPVIESALRRGALKHFSADLIPIDTVRLLVQSRNEDIRRMALATLASLHQPDDAEYVLANITEPLEHERGHDLHWLAPLPESHRLTKFVDKKGLFELVRRRRCAGLANDMIYFDESGTDEWSTRTAVEVNLAPPPALPVAHWIQRGDDQFLAGALDSALLVEDFAFAAYAYALLVDPHHRHAAVQLAWIDRIFGTPITGGRIAWLRALGVRDNDLLDDLARPTAPISVVRTRTSGVGRDVFERQLARVRAATGSG